MSLLLFFFFMCRDRKLPILYRDRQDKEAWKTNHRICCVRAQSLTLLQRRNNFLRVYSVILYCCAEIRAFKIFGQRGERKRFARIIFVWERIGKLSPFALSLCLSFSRRYNRTLIKTRNWVTKPYVSANCSFRYCVFDWLRFTDRFFRDYHALISSNF